MQILHIWGLSAPSDPLTARQGMSDNSLVSTGFLPAVVPPLYNLTWIRFSLFVCKVVSQDGARSFPGVRICHSYGFPPSAGLDFFSKSRQD